jgi:hypothetical protein
MTFLAEQPHLAPDQHPIINRPVGYMASQTFILEESTFAQLHMLEDERSLFVRMTPQTYSAQPARDLDGLGAIDRAMLLVAIATLHAAFRHLVMEGPSKLSADLAVAVKAQCWWFGSEDVFVRDLLMRVVAIIARDDIDVVLILVESTFANSLLLVTLRTHGDNLARRGFARIEDVDWTAARLDVLTPWTVTHLAALNRWNVLRALNRSKVRRPRVPGVLIRMTHLASVRPNVITSL